MENPLLKISAAHKFKQIIEDCEKDNNEMTPTIFSNYTIKNIKKQDNVLSKIDEYIIII